MKRNSSIIFGYFLIFLGAGFFLEQLGLVESFGSLLTRLWPVIFVFFGWKASQKRRYKTAMVFVGLAVVFFGSSWFGWNLWEVIWPLFIIVLGLMMLRPNNRTKFQSSKEKLKTNKFEQNLMFNSFERAIESDDFEKGEVNCIFGEAKIDMSKIKVKENADIEVNCIFGSLDLILPSGVNVVGDETQFMAEWNWDLVESKKKKAAEIAIKGNVFFGKVEVKQV